MSNAVANTIETIPAASPVAENSLVHMIERAARDPSVDLDKLERLMTMHERVSAKAAETAFNEAMAAAQAEMRPVATDANNPQTKSKYASYFALDKAMRPIYTKHGLALSFNTADCPTADYVRIVCDVTRGGYSKSYHIDMPADGKGAKGGDVMTKTHAVGAGASYGQRYLLKMIFNIAIGDDTDGNVPVNRTPITQDQLGELIALMESVGGNKPLFLKYFKVEALADLPAARFQEAMNMLNAKGRK